MEHLPQVWVVHLHALQNGVQLVVILFCVLNRHGTSSISITISTTCTFFGLFTDSLAKISSSSAFVSLMHSAS